MIFLSTPLGWLAVFIILLVIEMITLGLTTIWFAGGAAAAFIASLLNAPVWLQFLLFFAVSIVLLIFTRPAAVRFMQKGKEKTNLDRLIDSQGIVTQEINNEKSTGEVLVDGKIWMARTEEQEIIKKDAKVVIKEIKGVKLIVTK